MTQINALAQQALGVEFDFGRLAEAERYVIEAVRDIYRRTTLHRGDYITNGSLAAGNVAVTLTTTDVQTMQVDEVLMADTGDPLDYIEPAQFESESARLQGASGRPSVYTLRGADGLGSLTQELPVMAVLPTPDAAYELVIVGRYSPPTNELAETDPVPLPESFEHLAEWYTIGELFARDSDTEMASWWNARYEVGCREARGTLQQRKRGNRQVPGTWANLRSVRPRLRHPRGLF